MEDCDKEFNCGINEVKLAFFGDGTDDNIGVEKMVKEMHKIFTQTKWTTKVFLGFFAGVGIITGGIVGVYELIKRLK